MTEYNAFTVFLLSVHLYITASSRVFIFCKIILILYKTMVNIFSCPKFHKFRKKKQCAKSVSS